MVFYYHWEKEPNKAKVVTIKNGEEKVYMIDKVVCHVPTTTEKQDAHPKFKVCGICKNIEIFNDTLYIY